MEWLILGIGLTLLYCYKYDRSPVMPILVLVVPCFTTAAAYSAFYGGGSKMEGSIVFIALCFVGIFGYLLPSVVAWQRKHANANAICVLNIFLGWTFVGWVIALVWAFTSNVQSAQRVA